MNYLRPSPSDLSHARVVRALVSERRRRNWCLFLDRDGVINKRIVDDYVRRADQFEWLPKAREAIRILREWAPHMVVVTNQQGVGKGLMTHSDLSQIHGRLQTELGETRCIDEILVCVHLQQDDCRCRKPRPGLVLEWYERHPEAEASLGIVVGDSPSDMLLARKVAAQVGSCTGIRIGSIGSTGLPQEVAHFESLWDFAVLVQRIRNENGT
jgi:histidinol-phosphate phosphatase family protein